MIWKSLVACVALAMLVSVSADRLRAHESDTGAQPVRVAQNAPHGAMPTDKVKAPKGSPFSGEEALDISQAALGRTVSSYSFISSKGEKIDLAQFRGKPLIVSLIFTSCYHVCPLITENLRRAVATAQANLGEDSFSVVTIGFDTKVDSPARMAAFGRDHGVDLPNWHLLSADEQVIRDLTKEVGFIFFPTPRGFDHLSQTTILDREGRVYRQVYGANFTTPNIVEPVKELVFGRARDFTTVTGIVNRIRLFCTLYDPRDDRYYFDYSIFIGMVIGFVILTTIGTILARNIWRLWREQRVS